MRGSCSRRGRNRLEFIDSCEGVFQDFQWEKVALVLQIKDGVYSFPAIVIAPDAAVKGNCWSYARFGLKEAAAHADYLKLTPPLQHSL